MSLYLKCTNVQGYKHICHLEHQVENRSRSCWKVLQSDTDSIEQYVATSSANIFIVEQTADVKSLIIIYRVYMKCKGPRMGPCGTPDNTTWGPIR